MSRKLMYNPGVSVCLIPLDSTDTKLFLSVSDNYSIGKLIRRGIDAIYGLDSKGKRIYNSSEVRELIYEIKKDHEKYFSTSHLGYSTILRQGHGNIGLNNWAVGYLNDGITHQLIIPSGEPIMERIYPSLIKYGKYKKQYEITDIMYFYENTDNRKTLAWSEIEPKIVHIPDREVTASRGTAESVFLPVWEDSLTSQEIPVLDGSIDYKLLTDIRFVEIIKQHDGLLSKKDFQKIRIAKLSFLSHFQRLQEIEKSFYKIDILFDDVEFAFFGVPVADLHQKKSISDTLSGIIHYFYDLRHIFDLFHTKTGDKEFYVFEYALKKNNFEQAREIILKGKPATLNLAKLLTLIPTHNVATIKRIIADVKQDKPIQDLDSKGYRKVSTIVEDGDYLCYSSSDGDPIIEFLPLRNVYPYSFAGIIDENISKDGKEYLLLAVTTGQGGLRSGVFKGKTVLTPPLDIGFTIEEAVEAINTLLIHNKDKNKIILKGEIRKLLLLDQGGDVHQWVCAGGLNNVVGSSTDRAKLSAEIFVGMKK